VQIRAFKPRKNRYLETDGRGLSLDILPSGKKSWLYRYRLNGRQEKVILGSYPDLSLRDAREKRDRLAQIVAKGKSPAQEKTLARAGRSNAPTVAEFASRFYDEQVAKQLKKPRDILRYLNVEIGPHLRAKLLEDVTVLDCQHAIYRKRDKGHITTAIHLRGVLKRLFDYAIELQLVTMNPAQMVATRYIGKLRRRTRALGASEIRTFLRTVYGADIQRQFKLALHLILLTMVRKSELLLARWEHVNFETAEWFIPAANTKTGAEHIVPMSTQVAEMFRELEAIAGDSELVMPGRSSLRKPVCVNTLNKSLEGLTFDMPAFTIHDMRRTASTILHGNGFKPDVVEVALGHRIGGIRGIYNVQDYAAERKKMLQWWADFVDALVSERTVLMGNFGAGA
jgi:integrase